jgi:hypothetical protein
MCQRKQIFESGAIIYFSTAVGEEAEEFLFMGCHFSGNFSPPLGSFSNDTKNLNSRRLDFSVFVSRILIMPSLWQH